jgi:hypothetical protein
MLRIAEYSRDCFVDLRKELNIQYDGRQQGTLQMFRKESQMVALQKDIRVLEDLGIDYQPLDMDGCIEFEPALAHVREKFVAGLRLPGDETGDCFFKPNIVIDWFNNIKVSQTTREYIHSKLYSPKLRIRDLIDIENILQPYTDIIWDKNSIKHKFQIINNRKFYLLDAIKSNVSVLKFIYHYQNYYIPIDIALVDRKYKNSIPQRMYKYYTQDYYKILKSYRGKIIGYKYISEYNNIISQITVLIAVQYQLGFIITVLKNKLLSISEINRLIYNLCTILFTYGIKCSSDLNLIKFQVYNYVNNTLSKYVSYFTNVLLPHDKLKYSLNIKRGIESQIPTDFLTMQSRLDIAVLCPFFPTNMTEFKLLTSLSHRLDIHSETLIQCFSTVAIQFNIHVSDVIKEINKNNLSITTYNNHLILWENNNKIQEYNIIYKKRLQLHILFNISI